ncbi:MAG: PCRF domain-containing protein, partial [Patescibacteria group bacterium]
MDDYRKALIDAIDKKIEETISLLNDPDLKEMAETELTELNKQKNQIMGNFNEQGDNDESSLDERNIIIQASGAAGGEEAKLWADEL